MVIFLYNIFLPFVFLFFLPGIIIKLIRRDGYKKTYWERFGIFSADVKRALKNLSYPVWVHAVSVGETQMAVNFIKLWKERAPGINFVLSTTTITGQALARQKTPDDVIVIFAPFDFNWAVKKLLNMLHPKMLILFETEIWPNLIHESDRFGTKVVQVNARISDNSFKKYRRFRFFIRPFLAKLSVSCAQAALDVKRLKELCSSLCIEQTGTMKFDQKIPAELPEVNMAEVFGEGDYQVILGASTHCGEEKLIVSVFKDLLHEFPNLRLVLIPRHAERGTEVATVLEELQVSFWQRTNKARLKEKVKCFLVDTTGEMLTFMNKADIVIVGKSFAGNDEGQNIIEPALMSKAIIVGLKLKNFRNVMDIMLKKDALVSVADGELENALKELLKNPEKCKQLGVAAKTVVTEHIGVTQKTIDIIKGYLGP